MRRFLSAVLFLGLALTPGVAHGAGPKDYAKGAGTVEPFVGAPTMQFSFNAQSDPAGRDPKGTMTISFAGFEATAVVTCMRVVGIAPGGAALLALSGDVIRSNLAGFGDGLNFIASDGANVGTPDTFDFFTTNDSMPEEACSVAPPIFPLATGDVTIIDE